MASKSPHLRLVHAPLDEVADAEVREHDGGDAPPADVEEAFVRYGRYVAYIGTRILGRPADVDDLVQDVFLEAQRRLHTVRDPDAIKSWLATIAVRKARRMLKRRKMRRFFGLDDGSDYTQVVDETCRPDQRVHIADLYRMLDELPVDQRLAWTLRHLEGESLQRVADLCDCSLATAKRRIAAAHAMLEEELGDG